MLKLRHFWIDRGNYTSLEDSHKAEKQKPVDVTEIIEKQAEVFVKPTVRAIEKALNVGNWFEAKENKFTVWVNT